MGLGKPSENGVGDKPKVYIGEIHQREKNALLSYNNCKMAVYLASVKMYGSVSGVWVRLGIGHSPNLMSFF